RLGSVLDIANFNLICQQEIIIIAAVTTSVIISAIILTASCIWIRHKTAVKVFLYTRFNWHPFDRYDEDDLCKKYDAFVCYSSRNPDTIKWMRETLLYRLENSDPPYITYVHHRDFPVGNMIADTIAETIENSRRIIILLNNDFAKSPWGRLEFQLAHKKVLEDRRNRLIVIKMEEIEDAELDETIRHFIKTRTYLDVNDKKFWDKLFYALPEKRANKDMKEDQNNDNVEHANVDKELEHGVIQNIPNPGNFNIVGNQFHDIQYDQLPADFKRMQNHIPNRNPVVPFNHEVFFTRDMVKLKINEKWLEKLPGNGYKIPRPIFQ
ncbi:unnamed protein product, partial [Owenia fusiformis]